MISLIIFYHSSISIAPIYFVQAEMFSFNNMPTFVELSKECMSPTINKRNHVTDFFMIVYLIKSQQWSISTMVHVFCFSLCRNPIRSHNFDFKKWECFSYKKHSWCTFHSFQVFVAIPCDLLRFLFLTGFLHISGSCCLMVVIDHFVISVMQFCKHAFIKRFMGNFYLCVGVWASICLSCNSSRESPKP